MKFAIAATGDKVSGPGEATEILVYSLEDTSELLEIYENPAHKATSARGIAMLRSVLDRGVEKLVISGIGEHAFKYASGKVVLLNGRGMSTDQILRAMSEGTLKPINGSTHSLSH